MKRDIIVIGASAGGLEVVRALVAQLPAELPAAVFVVWHLSRDFPSQMAQVLARSTDLSVSQANDGEEIKLGHVFVAQPNHHLVLEKNLVRVTQGPTENRFRPSVDVLFRSAALAHGRRVIGVVLSGALDDGASGAYAIKGMGGLVIVQDPVEATYHDMPINTMKAVEVDYVVPVSSMGALLVQLVQGVAADARPLNVQGSHALRSHLEIEVGIGRGDRALDNGVMELGTPSPFTCPECHGVLLRIKEGNRLRFRCHTGHAFSTDSLLADISQHAEETLWSGVRALEESEMLLKHIAAHLGDAEQSEPARPFLEKAEEVRIQSSLVRQVALGLDALSKENIVPPPPTPPSPEANPAPDQL